MIRLRFTYQPTFQNRVIRLFTWYEYTHVELEALPGMYIGAVPGKGVALHSTQVTKEKFMLLDVDHTIVLKYIQAELGKKYDLWGAIGIGLRHDIGKKDRWFCSELLGEAINAAKPTFSIPSYKLTPRDIALVCRDE